MYWNESKKSTPINESQSMVDASIKFMCKQLPGDHVFSLYQVLIQSFPFLKDEPSISIQQLFLPSSGNGWQREEHSTSSIIHLSKRTRLTIRIPISFKEKIKQLCNTKLMVDGHNIELGSIKFMPITTSEILVSRFAYYSDTDNDEQLFLEKAYHELSSRKIDVAKMLCGKMVSIASENKVLHTRSLMLADLSPQDSLLLQEKGIGEYYSMGCGIFIPQKGIKPVNPDDQ